MKLSEIAKAIGLTVHSDVDADIEGVASLDEAGPSDISFLSNQKYRSMVESSSAAAVLVPKGWSGKAGAVTLEVDDPDASFAAVVELFSPSEDIYEAGIHSSSVISGSAVIDATAHIGPGCVIESGVSIGAGTVLIANCYIGRDSSLGSDCLIYPQVSMREGCAVGDRVIIHNGAVIGSDGFGYSQENGVWKKIRQVGTVEICDDVEIGANSTIDRARFGKTVIGKGAKIDNLVQIAHNVRVGENTAMAAQVGVSGSTVIGRNVRIGGQAGLAGHLTVGDYSVVGGQSGVIGDIPGAVFVSGYPAQPHKKAMKAYAYISKLPDMKKKISQLERELDELKKL